jgi:hypothetical protein
MAAATRRFRVARYAENPAASARCRVFGRSSGHTDLGEEVRGDSSYAGTTRSDVRTGSHARTTAAKRTRRYEGQSRCWRRPCGIDRDHAIRTRGVTTSLDGRRRGRVCGNSLTAGYCFGYVTHDTSTISGHPASASSPAAAAAVLKAGSSRVTRRRVPTTMTTPHTGRGSQRCANQRSTIDDERSKLGLRQQDARLTARR